MTKKRDDTSGDAGSAQALPPKAPRRPRKAVGAGSATRTSSRVLAAASHELRAPLHTIIGMGELLGRTSLTPAQEQYLDALRRAARTLAGMLENAFDGGTADVVASSERLWLPDIIEAVVAIVRDRAAASTVSLDVTVAPDVPRRLLGDPLRLQQVLINLMVNAVKYAPGGGVALRVFVDGDPGGERVALVFEVEDTGAGIEREALERIFEPHFRLPEHAHLDGAGLGLGITRRLVDELGGTITVASRTRSTAGNTGKTGSTFRVRLGFRQTASADTAAVGLQNLQVIVVGSNDLEAAVTQALEPWSPNVIRQSPETLKATLAAPSTPTRPAGIVICDETSLQAIGQVAGARVVAVLSADAASRHGDQIDREGVVPIFWPVTAGSLVGALRRISRQLDGSAPDDQTELRGAVIHAADDDDDARALLRAFLSSTGARLCVYASVADLVAGVSNDPSATMVLCDVEMPDGGARVALAALPKNDDVSFVAITAHGPDMAARLRAEGFTEVVRKPLTRQGLIELVRRLALPKVRAPVRDARPQPLGSTDGEALQLEARMALARRDYRALTLLARRVPQPLQAQLAAAAREHDDATLRDLLRQLDAAPRGPPTVEQTVRSLMQDYLKHRIDDANELSQCVDANAFDRVAFIAHRVAGTAAAYGQPALGEIAESIEAASRRRASDEIRTLITRFRALLPA